jgi:hypothetical protein
MALARSRRHTRLLVPEVVWWRIGCMGSYGPWPQCAGPRGFLRLLDVINGPICGLYCLVTVVAMVALNLRVQLSRHPGLR